jgi:DNA repair protein RecN (Recombination protein N)
MMLRELRIKNFTIIESLEIDFKPGFNVITGETGAGKSIIVDAIGIVLGEKTSVDIIKTGAKETLIEAHFDAVPLEPLNELGIDCEDGIVVRRIIPSHGKGRAFINDTSVTLQTLTSIASSLVTIHGQHEQYGLMKKENHVLFLDYFGGIEGDVDSLRKGFSELSGLRNRLSEMKNRLNERAQRIEFLKFQIGEIDAADIKAGEKSSIEEERAILLNLNKLKEASETAYSMLYSSEGACIEQFSNVINRVKEMAAIDRSADEALTLLQSCLPLMKDGAMLLRGLKEKYDIDPERLTALDERLEIIKKLEKKYGDSAERILSYRETAESELKSLESIDEQQHAIESEITALEASLNEMAEALSCKREQAARTMEALIAVELKELGFQKAVFKVDIKKKEALSAEGIDDIEFLFSANPGEPARALNKVASGGELSRIMLGLKCIEISGQSLKDRNLKPNSQSIELKTLIFDEVDAGIGGVTARHVGAKLKAIAANYQVFCITHLPQIATMADCHFKVDKTAGHDITTVSVRHVENSQRETEIARMLGGSITDASLSHAREMLERRA